MEYLLIHGYRLSIMIKIVLFLFGTLYFHSRFSIESDVVLYSYFYIDLVQRKMFQMVGLDIWVYDSMPLWYFSGNSSMARVICSVLQASI
jgi:hypothetical protein